MPFDFEMIILNENGEIHIPITEYQHNLLNEKLQQFKVSKAFIFPDEDSLNAAIDKAIKNKLF